MSRKLDSAIAELLGYKVYRADWEPPRIATGVKDRVQRLKALGNAVVPQQAYPILKAIAEQVFSAEGG